MSCQVSRLLIIRLIIVPLDAFYPKHHTFTFPLLKNCWFNYLEQNWKSLRPLSQNVFNILAWWKTFWVIFWMNYVQTGPLSDVLSLVFFFCVSLLHKHTLYTQQPQLARLLLEKLTQTYFWKTVNSSSHTMLLMKRLKHITKVFTALTEIHTLCDCNCAGFI